MIKSKMNFSTLSIAIMLSSVMVIVLTDKNKDSYNINLILSIYFVFSVIVYCYFVAKVYKEYKEKEF